jgi:hypothetical protein
MDTDTTELIDTTIEHLQQLQGVFADDFHLCRRTGLATDARRCSDALEAISLLLPRLELARAMQQAASRGYAPGSCRNCD